MACAGSVASGDGHVNLYATSGAMFLGLLGVFFFAAPGGSIGAMLGALAGIALAKAGSSAP